MRARGLMCLAGIAILIGVAYAVQLETKLNPERAKVGDRLVFELHVRDVGPADVTFPIPEMVDFVLLDIDSSQVAQGTIRYVLAVYDTGNYVVEEMPVHVGGDSDTILFTSRQGVVIESVAPDTASTVLPIKGFREHPFRWIDVWRALVTSPWTWVALGLLVFVVAWLVWRRFFRRTAETEMATVVILPPHEQAVRDLIALRERRYPSRGMMREYFSDYSQIMRAYLERRYQRPALEMTTFDLDREFENAAYPDVLRRRLMPTFHEADLVKFAKYIPPLETTDDVLEAGFEVVAQTRPVENEQSEAQAA